MHLQREVLKGPMPTWAFAQLSVLQNSGSNASQPGVLSGVLKNMKESFEAKCRGRTEGGVRTEPAYQDIQDLSDTGNMPAAVNSEAQCRPG